MERVLDIMRKGAVTCGEETPVKEIAQIMVINRIHYCVVVDNKHDVLGIISSRSILKAYGRDLENTRARDILLPYTITITQNDPIKEAVEIMNRKRIEHLIVVSDRADSRAVLGILDAADIIEKMLHP